MTNDEYLSLIEQGVETWNRWREQNPAVQPDLHRAYLFEANLSGANLSGVNLSRACLIGANLTGANLQGANLSGAYASGANCQRANLAEAVLNGGDFSRTNLVEADLSKAKAGAANFTSAQFTGACIENWHINSATQLENVECQYVYLRQSQQERRPQQGEFDAGEFSQLFQITPVGEYGNRSAKLAENLIGLDDLSTAVGVLTPVEQRSFDPVRFGNSFPAVTPQRDRDWRWMIWGVGIGIGITALAIALTNFLSSSGGQTTAKLNSERSQLSAVQLPPLVCQEPLPPALPNRAPDHQYQTGTKFYGKVSNELPANGRGIMAYSGGNRYDGEYQRGKRNGCGTFMFANGRSYVGQFRDDWFHGQGVWTLENGDRYIGEFRNNKCHGRGTFIFADGSSQSGNWQNGNLVGTNLSCDRSPIQLPRSLE